MRRRDVLRGAATAGAGTRETDVVIEAEFEVVNDEDTALASAKASDTPTLTVERSGYDAQDYGECRW